MLDLHSTIEFSQINCVAICSFLVPMNFLASLQSIILTVLRRPQQEINLIAVLGNFAALILFLHVGTWLIEGVVRIETFILLGLVSFCLTTNTWAIIHNKSMRAIIQFLREYFVKISTRLTV